jgi:ADP-ribose pyrophosphatase
MPDQAHLPILTLGSQTVWESPWYSLRQDRIQMPGGSQGTYTVVDRRGAVFIIPRLPDGRVALIRHYRHTVGGWLWEIPAGGIEEGHSPLETAHRELLEEIGGRAAAMAEIGTFYTMPGISNERCVVFYAEDVQIGQPNHEASEVIETHLFAVDETLRMARDGTIQDGPSALCLLLAEPFLRRGGIA